MAKAARSAQGTRGRARKGDPLLADRLLALFGFELGVLEAAVEPLRTSEGEGRDLAIGAKGRIEALGQMVRTLEKLLELQQMEALAAGSDAPDREAERLAAELMRRLRVLDRRRRGGLAATPSDDAASVERADAAVAPDLAV